MYSAISSAWRASGSSASSSSRRNDDVDSALGSHDRDFGRRPSEVEVGADVLRAHHVVRTTVGLARDDGELGNRRLAVGVEELRAVADDPAPLLRCARQEARHVDEGDERHVERIAEAHKARALDRGIDVECPRDGARVVRDDPDRMPAEAREAADDVLGPELVDREEVPLVDHKVDDLAHVVGLVRIVRDDSIELGRLPVGRVARLEERWRLRVVLRQEREEVARVVEALLLGVRDDVRDPRLRSVRGRAAELLERDLLARHRLHDLGAGDEHVRGLLDHQNRVGHRGVSRRRHQRTGPSRARSAGRRPRPARCAKRSRHSRRERRRPPECVRRPSH